MLLRFRSVLAALALGLAAACAPPAPPPPPPPADTTAADTAALNKLRDDYAAAFNAGDASRLAGLMTADEVSMNVDTATSAGREANLEANKGLFSQMTPSDVAIKSEELKLMGDYAYDRGTFSLTLTPKAKGGKPLSRVSRYLVILHRESDGSWKLARDISNAVPPPPQPAK